MRLMIISFFLIILFPSCESDNPSPNDQIMDGTYLGYFIHENHSYWYSIHFANGNYFERPSGIEKDQKELGCISYGSYSLVNNILSFEYEYSVFSDQRDPCLVDWSLPGSYNIINSKLNDSLVFERGSGENHISYHLKKMEIE
jgi:hypothetical protein